MKQVASPEALKQVKPVKLAASELRASPPQNEACGFARSSEASEASGFGASPPKSEANGFARGSEANDASNFNVASELRASHPKN